MRSAANVLAVVEELAAGAEALGVGELARRTDIAKTTVQRCLDTLAAAGWIELADEARAGGPTRWRLSDHFASLGRPVSLERFVDRARGDLDALATATGESVHLVLLDGTDVVLLARVAGPSVVQVVLPDGFRVPAYASATGKAMLAAMPDDERERHLPDRLRRLTDSTIQSRSDLREELARVERRGWATNTGEWEPSVVAVAAAVRRPGFPMMAVSVSSTRQRLTPDRVETVAAMVVDTAAALGRSRVPAGDRS